MEDYIKKLELIFIDKLQEKTNWGRNQIAVVFKDSVNEMLLAELKNKKA